MAERSLRGMSIGAKSLESDDNVDFAARNDVAYVCPKGHRTIWDMLLERRSEEELATLLEKRLQMHRDGWIPDYE